MPSIFEQLPPAGKAVFVTQAERASAFAQVGLASGMTLIELNMDAVEASLAAATVGARQLTSVNSLQEWISITASQSQLAIERASAYARQAADIARDTRDTFSRMAETAVAGSRQKMADPVRQAPVAATVD